jgi:hypothetical protein
MSCAVGEARTLSLADGATPTARTPSSQRCAVRDAVDWPWGAIQIQLTHRVASIGAVSAGFLQVIGAHPVAGRVFTVTTRKSICRRR